MKTEMKMLENGNYENVISPIQHKCYSKSYFFKCIEYGWDLGKLYLIIDSDDSEDDGYQHKIEVNYCPICGYHSENKKK